MSEVIEKRRAGWGWARKGLCQVVTQGVICFYEKVRIYLRKNRMGADSWEGRSLGRTEEICHD